jgi:hypothetical protein
MAKARRATKKAVGGPYLEAAFICERVLQDKDGTYSAIRMVNRITFWEVVSEPERGTPFVIPLMAVVSFKAGDVREKRELYLHLTSPSGKRKLLPGFKFPMPLSFEDGDTGVLLPFQRLILRYEGEGTYWIDVVLGKKLYSRIPLTLVLRKEPPQEPPG